MKPLLKNDGTYDRARIVAEANRLFAYMRRKNADDWPRQRCLAFLGAQARIMRAERLGAALAPPRKRKATLIRAPRPVSFLTMTLTRHRADARQAPLTN